MNPIISFIIPIYNSQQYLAKCLDSILHQTLTSFEIILVDDGSIDNSKEIALEYATKHKNICLITKTNEGVTTARLLGLTQSQGEYICFVDSDDTIPPNAIEQLYNKSNNGKIDIVIGASKHINPDNSYFFVTNNINKEISINEYIKILLTGNHNGLVAKIIRRECLSAHFFQKVSKEIKLNEDFLLNIFLATNSQSVTLHEDLYVYNYYLHPTSSSRTIIQPPQIWFNIIDLCETTLKESNLLEEVSLEMYLYKLNTIYRNILLLDQNITSCHSNILSIIKENKKHKTGIKYQIIIMMLKYSYIRKTITFIARKYNKFR